MGQMYTAHGEAQVIAAAGDMMEALCPSTKALIVHRWWVEQSTEFGDAQSEQIVARLSRVTGAPTSGSGGTTVTPTVMYATSPASGITVEINNTTDLTGGTKTTITRRAFNVMNGIEVVYTPEERPTFSPSTRFLLELITTPADSITWEYGVTWEEIG